MCVSICHVKSQLFNEKNIVALATILLFLPSVCLNVFQDYCLTKKLVTFCTCKWIFPSMCPHMTCKIKYFLMTKHCHICYKNTVSYQCVFTFFFMITDWWKSIVILATCIWILTSVCPHMSCEITAVGWQNHCHIYYKNMVSPQSVCRCFLKITAWWKNIVTLATCIWISPCVSPNMTCKIKYFLMKKHCHIC